MKIEINDLILQLKVILADEFIAEVAQKDGDIILDFVGGQKFLLNVKEI